MEIRRSEFRSPLALIMLAIIVILLTIMIIGDEFLNDEILDISGRNWFMMTTHGIWYGEPYKDEKDCEAARKKMLQETEDLLKNHPDVLSAKPCPAADVDACMEDAADSSIGLLRAGKVYCSLNH